MTKLTNFLFVPFCVALYCSGSVLGQDTTAVQARKFRIETNSYFSIGDYQGSDFQCSYPLLKRSNLELSLGTGLFYLPKNRYIFKNGFALKYSYVPIYLTARIKFGNTKNYLVIKEGTPVFTYFETDMTEWNGVFYAFWIDLGYLGSAESFFRSKHWLMNSITYEREVYKNIGFHAGLLTHIFRRVEVDEAKLTKTGKAEWYLSVFGQIGLNYSF